MECRYGGDYLITCAAVGLLIILLYLVFDWLLRRRLIPDISSKYVLITGCDSGFGERACEKLDLLGCNVIATCLTEAGLDKIKQKCSARVRAIKMDVAEEASILEAVESVSKILPEGTGLWGVVNNAGISGDIGPLEWLDRSSFEKLFQVNVMGMVTIVHCFLPLLKKSDGGRIVNTASILGRVSLPFAAPYCMTKSAIEAYSDALRIEMYSCNIKVSIIEPGGHKTPFLNQLPNYVSSAWNNLPESKKHEYGENYLKQVLFLATKMIPFFGSKDLNPVADAYCHALFSTWPRRRYLVGLDTYIYCLLDLLPSIFTDIAFLVVLKLATILK